MAAIISQIKNDIMSAEAEVLRLYIHLQKAEADFSNMMEEEEVLEAARKLADLSAPFYPLQAEGTKLKWVSNTDAETYRVAIVRYDGILEVKLVTNGRGYCHDDTICKCNSCSEIRLSGGKVPPWLKGVPLIKTFFKDEAAWRASLPADGTVTITPPPLSERALKKLCMEPLKMMTDAGRLEELEKRFPGATMVLSTDKMQLEIEYMGDSERNMHRIFSNTTNELRSKFSDFGAHPTKPNLMAEWRGMYIGLEHLF